MNLFPSKVKPIHISSDSSLEDMAINAQSYSSKWHDFASNTTLHGLRYVFIGNSSVSKRVIWLCFLLACALVYVYFVSASFYKYFSLPMKTIIHEETPPNGLKFPAVTICNLNRVMKSKINMPESDEDFQRLGLNISGCSAIREARGNLTCGQALLCTYEWYGPATVDGCNKETQRKIISALNDTSERIFDEGEFFTKYGHDMRSMFVVYCRFMLDMLCKVEDFVPTLTTEGICYTFNSGKTSPVLHALFEGPDLGLGIILDVQTNENTFSTFSNGLKVIVHDQDTFVNHHVGFNILPGTHALVGIKLRKHIRLPPPYRTHCRQKGLLGIGSYTKDGCVYQCINRETNKRCGCRVPGLPALGTTNKEPLCSIQDRICVMETRSNTNLTAYSCSSACSEMEYSARVSYSKFPDNGIIQIMQRFFKAAVNPTYMKENYVFLQVGFQHLAFEKREDVSAYGAESLFGEIGGSMGLFLGCSLLTLCEFIDFLWTLILARVNRPKIANQQLPST